MGLTDAQFGQIINALGPAEVKVATGKLLISDMLSKGNITLHSGSAPFEEAHLPSAGITATPIYSGGESIPMTSTDGLKKTKVSPHMIAANVAFTEKELLSVQKTGDVFVGSAQNLIKMKVDAAVDGLTDDLINWFLVAANVSAQHPFLASNATTLADVITLNGIYAGGGLTGNIRGLLDFAAPSAQNEVVMDLAKAVSSHHYNQYRAATDWDTDGMATIRKVIADCSTFNKGKFRGEFPDVGICDPETFSNILEAAKANVRTASANDNGEVKAPGLLVTELNDIRVHSTTMMNGTVLNSAGANGTGTMYILNSRYLKWITTLDPEAVPGKDGSMETKLKMFHVGKPQNTSITGTRGVIVPITMYGNFHLSELPAHGIANNLAA